MKTGPGRVVNSSGSPKLFNLDIGAAWDNLPSPPALHASIADTQIHSRPMNFATSVPKLCDLG
jgi:hypothetical protein